MTSITTITDIGQFIVGTIAKIIGIVAMLVGTFNTIGLIRYSNEPLLTNEDWFWVMTTSITMVCIGTLTYRFGRWLTRDNP